MLNSNVAIPIPRRNALLDHLDGQWRNRAFRATLWFSSAATPLGFSQQYEAQQNLPKKVFYVTGDSRCSVFIRVESTTLALQEEWLKVQRY